MASGGDDGSTICLFDDNRAARFVVAQPSVWLELDAMPMYPSLKSAAQAEDHEADVDVVVDLAVVLQLGVLDATLELRRLGDGQMAAHFPDDALVAAPPRRSTPASSHVTYERACAVR